jgi:hypothetical protein
VPGSYRGINYSLRPGKHIERKMLAEALSKLTPFGPLHSYRYVGFGSIYFADFIVIHRGLGIDDMVSIEEQVQDEARVASNKPFACIRLEYGSSNDMLPTLDWSKKTIAWLDYDGRLNRSVLADTAWFFTAAEPGSVYILTVNVQAGEPAKGLDQLTDAVGIDRVPPGIVARDLTSWGLADVSRRIVTNEIRDTLYQRNGGRRGGESLRFRQLFHFRYADTARLQLRPSGEGGSKLVRGAWVAADTSGMREGRPRKTVQADDQATLRLDSSDGGGDRRAAEEAKGRSASGARA